MPLFMNPYLHQRILGMMVIGNIQPIISFIRIRAGHITATIRGEGMITRGIHMVMETGAKALGRVPYQNL
jgi:hypothetical protein